MNLSPTTISRVCAVDNTPRTPFVISSSTTLSINQRAVAPLFIYMCVGVTSWIDEFDGRNYCLNMQFYELVGWCAL